MSFDSIEKSTALSQPYELYLFQGTGIDFAFTPADQSIDFLAHTFVPATLSRDAIDVSSEVNSGQIKIYAPASQEIAQRFIGYLPTSPVSITIYGGHYGDSETGVVFSGAVASAHFTDEGECELICNSDQYKLQTKIPRVQYQSLCPKVFGSPECGVSLATVTYLGTISAIADDGVTVTVPDFDGLPHPLKGGRFNVGNQARMIVGEGGSGSSKFVKLIAGISGMQVGDSVEGVAACVQDFASCVSYNNSGNFLGFDLMPALNPFDGSIT